LSLRGLAHLPDLSQPQLCALATQYGLSGEFELNPGNDHPDILAAVSAAIIHYQCHHCPPGHCQPNDHIIDPATLDVTPFLTPLNSHGGVSPMSHSSCGSRIPSQVLSIHAPSVHSDHHSVASSHHPPSQNSHFQSALSSSSSWIVPFSCCHHFWPENHYYHGISHVILYGRLTRHCLYCQYCSWGSRS
jgi:hypothetical protein